MSTSVAAAHRDSPSSSSKVEEVPQRLALPPPPGYSATSIAANYRQLPHASDPNSQTEWDPPAIRNGSAAGPPSTSYGTLRLSPIANDGVKRRRLSESNEGNYSHLTHAHLMHQQQQQQAMDQANAQIDELSPSRGYRDSDSPPGDAGSEIGGNGRTLKQTKRAAQNRAAQQAFRKRKEERMRELEQKERILNGLLEKEAERNLDKQRDVEDDHHERSRIQATARGIGARPGAGHASVSPPSGVMVVGHPGAGSGNGASGHPVVNDWDRAFANSNGPVQHLAERLEAVSRDNEDLRALVDELRARNASKDRLVESLRTSLEDLGAENRMLRERLRSE